MWTDRGMRALLRGVSKGVHSSPVILEARAPRQSRLSGMDRDFLNDLFADFGPVTIRPMFSGYGISVDGTNFALALRAGLYFRADDQTIPQFEAEGSKPFQYQTRAKTVTVGS
jgi:TfoX/Sxy family transcriptional regulator of competence genes